MKYRLLILLAVLFFSACHGRKQTEEEAVETFDLELPPDQQAFLDNLASLCGQSFYGEQTYSAPDRVSWADEELKMHVTFCENNQVHIPLHVGEDESRTWIFLAESGLLRFRHDHRRPDGTPEEITLYGGYADGEGTPFMQSFPADDYTYEMLDDPEYERQWNVIMDKEMTTFSYQLLLNGELVFQADFDLTDPI